ncbi:unnamed protein product [Nesidiocoris tenuis]|uniref:beta-N-acetylhexosaminidase n=1 Tax=Nesidiocoris tenuis TaxID=355587 RepID=A0A6H5GLL3_9HEMI|nr:unnamed protein product [Nesidiocoris tenuis]
MLQLALYAIKHTAISKLFLLRLWKGCEMTRTPSTQVQVHLRAKKDDLTLDMDTSETYKIVITTNGQRGQYFFIKSDQTRKFYSQKKTFSGRLIEAFIEGETVYGVRHGLETLLQLTARKDTKGRCSVLMLTRAVIKDAPLFQHRGILIDTARNFIPLPDLKRTIDGMGSVKLNVLHWHAVDSHSFPLELNRLPQMAKTGAYSSRETYSVAEQEELIEYAKLRGVRLVMEIDSPAHAGNGWTWGPEAGLGEMVLCANKEPWQRYCLQPPCGQLNPINPNTYKVLGEIFKELSGRFTAHDMFHLGGDEVKFDCWNSTKSIQDYLLAKGLDLSAHTFTEFWGEFHLLGGEVCMWSEYVDKHALDMKIWPRAAAVAERLWSDPKRECTIECNFVKHGPNMLPSSLKSSISVLPTARLHTINCYPGT